MMTNGRIERTFTFAPGMTPKIVARNPSGVIDVQGEAREDVAVLVTCDPADALERGLEVRIEQQGDTVRVETKWPHLPGGLRTFKARVTMEIRVPRMSAVNADLASGEARITGIEGDVWVNNASGDIRVNEVRGFIGVNTASGDIRMSDTHGTTRVHTASGDVVVERGTGQFSFAAASGDIRLDSLTGTLEVNTASGDVTANGSAFVRAKVKSISGDVSLATPLDLHGDYHFQTVSGDVLLLVPEHTVLTLTYSTLSGDVSAALPMQREGGKRSGTLIVNGGGVPVRMSSVSGDCLVRAARSSLPALPLVDAVNPFISPASTEPTLPEEMASSETLRVLQAVERGELSIDEAMDRLASVEE